MKRPELRNHLAWLATSLRGSFEEMCRLFGTSPAAVDSARAFAAHHQLLGYCGYLLQDHAQREEIPSAFLGEVATHAKKLGRKNQQLQSTLPTIAAAFEQADVPFLLLKGPHIALRFYGGLERRTFWDMDLLVRPADLSLAHQLLSAQGYRKASRRFINERASRFFTHAYDYHKPHTLDIDLHWKLANHPGLRLNYASIWQSKQDLMLGGTSFSTLSDAYALTFLLIGIVKDFGRGSLRLRSMVDLYRILAALDRKTDWPRFFEDRKEEGSQELCFGALTVFFSLFQVRAEEFPRLFENIGVQLEPQPGLEEVLFLLQPGRFAMRNKRWASRYCATSRLGYAGWWALSLPARLVVHQKVRRRKPKTRASSP